MRNIGNFRFVEMKIKGWAHTNRSLVESFVDYAVSCNETEIEDWEKMSSHSSSRGNRETYGKIVRVEIKGNRVGMIVRTNVTIDTRKIESYVGFEGLKFYN